MHPAGYIEGPNRINLSPTSLYLRQLQDRGFATTDVSNETEKDLPDGFALHGNAPNPFTTTTTFSYSLEATGHVRLEVFDMLGRSVAVLVDEHQPAGAHKALFDASHLPSGTYISRFSTNKYAHSQVMTLVK